MATNTEMNIGVRRNFTTLGNRNFETSGTVQYKAEKDGFNFLGTSYHRGDLLPFDVGGVSYSATAIAQLQLAWDNQQIQPTV